MFSRRQYKPKKSLSQNYLIDENVCKKIAEQFGFEENDYVVEIGAGRGEIGKYLAGKSRRLTLVELDPENAGILKERFSKSRANIINEDILKINFDTLSENGKVRVIGNIPYKITSEILFKLIDNRNIISDALLMVQEEVAQRLTAKPRTKEYGITSVFTQVFAKPELLFKISRNSFYPKPNVDSRILKIDFGFSLEDQIKNIQFFKNFVRGAFGKRRKTLSNALKYIGIETKKSNLDFDFNRRAETLSPGEFIKLSNLLG